MVEDVKNVEKFCDIFENDFFRKSKIRKQYNLHKLLLEKKDQIIGIGVRSGFVFHGICLYVNDGKLIFVGVDRWRSQEILESLKNYTGHTIQIDKATIDKFIETHGRLTSQRIFSSGMLL